MLDPEIGALAAGEGSGAGRMPEPETIVAHVARLLERRIASRAQRASSPPARRASSVDPVRVLSNRSSGRMGVALAAAAWRRGANVTLIAGPLEVPRRSGRRVVRVETTEEMSDAVNAAAGTADVLVMAAAPADFRAARRREREDQEGRDAPRRIELAPTPDILRESVAAHARGRRARGLRARDATIGIANARQKLESQVARHDRAQRCARAGRRHSASRRIA